MSAFVSDRLERVLPTVAKPGRYAGGETNAVTKPDGVVRTRLALAFPDSYEIGMSNFALSILYEIANERPDVHAERVFAPWPDMARAMRRSGIPLYTLETRTPLRDCHVVGFSLAFELCYTNVLDMLDLAGLPIYSSDRDERHPLIIAGGHCASNPEPMAPFIDAFAIGDGEQVLGSILDAEQECRGRARADLLARLAKIPGVYVSGLYDAAPDGCVQPRTASAPLPVERCYVSDLDAARHPVRPVVPLIEVVHDRISIEVMRGCARGCRFCQAGMITRPVRERSADEIAALADRLARSTGYDDISLLSLSTSDHSQIESVVRGLIDRHGSCGIGVSLPSLRADRDCVELARSIQTVRKTGLTFAPEAGTQRLRDAINKGVTEDDLMSAVETAFGAGWRHVKLYFMIGLPTETDDDIAGIADLLHRVLAVGRRRAGRAASIAAGIAGFVPKPHTPFQWRAQDDPGELRRKQALLRTLVRDRAVKLSFHDPLVSQVEGVLARGDRSVARAIVQVWRHGGGFDAWSEHFSHEAWMAAFGRAGVDVARTTHRRRGYDEPLPWDIVSYGVSKAYLRAEDKRAAHGQTTEDCHVAPCTFCGACERFETERRATHARAVEGGESDERVR